MPKLMHMMNSNLSSFPGLASLAEDANEKRRYKWLLPLCNWVGITMANEQNPRGWSWNPATITLFLVVIGMVAVGFYWMGQRDSETQQLLQRLDRIEKTAQQAKELSIVASSNDGPGHEKPTPEATKPK